MIALGNGGFRAVAQEELEANLPKGRRAAKNKVIPFAGDVHNLILVLVIPE